MRRGLTRDNSIPGALIIIALFLLSLCLVASATLSLGPTPQSKGSGGRDASWDAVITATASGKTDTTTFGEAVDAHGGPPPDAYDVAKPPFPIPPYVRIFFNDSLEAPYNQLWKDYRHYQGLTTIWNLTVQWVPDDYATPSSVTLTWSTASIGLCEYDFVYLCKTDGTPLVNMRTTDHYTFACPAVILQNFRIRCIVDQAPPVIVNHSPASGETGDSFTFNVNITDNIAPPEQITAKVNWVHGSHTGNDTLTYTGSDNTFTKTVTLDNYTVSDLTYHIYAIDSAKIPKSVYTAVIHATVTDDEAPTITGASGDTDAGTNDVVTLWAQGIDNIQVTSAKATIGITDHAMTWVGARARWEYDYTTPANSLDPVSYTISLSDNALNTKTSSLYTITLYDDDAPQIGASSTAISTGTGNQEVLWVQGTDNIAVISGVVTIDSTPHDMTWNTTTLRWEYLYQVPSGSTASHTYSMTLADAVPNTASTGTFTITVVDDDPPVITGTSDNISTGTGNSEILWVQATENIAITAVDALVDGVNHTMTLNGGRDQYTFIAPTSSTLPHTYRVFVSDATHTTRSYLYTITVSDDDAPTITANSTAVTVGTGNSVTLWLQATDNIAVVGATATIDATGHPMTWNTTTLRWEYVYTAPNNNIAGHTYTVSAYDSVPNTRTNDPRAITVFDDEFPQISLIVATPSSQLVGQPVTLSATITDNVMLQEERVSVDGPAGFTPVNVSLVRDGGDVYFNVTTYGYTGTYNFTIWVRDTSNNRVTSAINHFTIYSELPITNAVTGWNYISLPFNQTITKVNLYVIIGGQRKTWATAVTDHIVMDTLYDWLRTTQNYSLTGTMKAGRGYWMYAYADCEIWATNLNPMVTDTYITPLTIGWNAFGIPCTLPVDKTSLVVRYLGVEYTWAQATSTDNAYGSPLVMKDLFDWQRSTQAYEMITTLSPGTSIWIYAYQPCELKRA